MLSILIIIIGFSIIYYHATQPMTYQILTRSEPIIDNKFNFRIENKKYERHYQFEMPENITIKPGQQVLLNLLFEHTNDVIWGLNIGENDVITAITVNDEKIWPNSDLVKPLHITRIE
jgi:hypothetical protein